VDEKMLSTALLILARAAHIAASILITGTLTFQIIALGSASSSFIEDFRDLNRQLLRLTFGALVAALVSAFVWYWLEVVNMSGLSLVNSFSGTAWQTVLFQTKFGRAWLVRLGVIALLFALTAFCFGGDKPRRACEFVAWLLSVVLLVSLAWISHAAAVSTQPLGTLGDAVHLYAAAAWIGGLLPLAIFLRRARASLSLRKSAPRVIGRFSTLSLCCATALIITGISNSWLLVGSFHALFTTVYGWLLVGKLAMFGLLLFLGANNRFVAKKLRNVGGDSDLLSRLRRNVLLEMCFGAAVIAIVACLGVTPPARHF
jgi:putative copper resistance protein D